MRYVLAGIGYLVATHGFAVVVTLAFLAGGVVGYFVERHLPLAGDGDTVCYSVR